MSLVPDLEVHGENVENVETFLSQAVFCRAGMRMSSTSLGMMIPA